MNKASLKIFAVDARNELMGKMRTRLEILGISNNGIEKAKVVGKEVEVKGALYPKESYNSLIRKYRQVGYEELVEESAYTWFNRLTALAFMEANEYIDELRKSIKSTYNNYRDEIAKSDIKNISVTIAKAIKDKEDYHAEINGKAKKKERVVIRKISISSKTNIETEDQVKEYISLIEKNIEKLKSEMLEAVKNNKIVDIG